MKTNNFISYLLIFSGACLFQWLFWHEVAGINYLIYSVFTVFMLSFIFPESLKRIPFWLTSLGLLATGIAIAIHASSFSIVMYVFSFLFFVCFSQWSTTRSPVYAIPSSIVGMVLSPYTFFASKKRSKGEKSSLSGFAKWFRIVIIPVVILILFFIIFYNASDKFAEYSDKILEPIQNLLKSIFGNITFLSIFIFIHAILLTTWLVFRNKASNLSDDENNNALIITRKRNSKKRRFSKLGLNKEYLSALVLLVMINLLVLAANIIDIIFLWFGFEFKEGMNLKQFVHEGTYLLILSILLSMGILLYIFRKNQNFFSKGKILRTFASLWVSQNFILAISVGLRNYHYIEHYGLAYKRIGVCIFLILVLYGLITFLIKILKKKSGYYLINRNSWAMYLVLTCVSLFSWDTIITKYNVENCKEPDYHFLVNMSTKALPYIDINKVPSYYHDKNPWVTHGSNRYNYNYNYSYDFFYPGELRDQYVKRVFEFMYCWETRNNASWNYYDEIAYKKFVSNPQLIEKYRVFRYYKSQMERIQNEDKKPNQKRNSDTGYSEPSYD